MYLTQYKWVGKDRMIGVITDFIAVGRLFSKRFIIGNILVCLQISSVTFIQRNKKKEKMVCNDSDVFRQVY